MIKLISIERIAGYGKLFLSGVILVWLFIRSPFNPLYEDMAEHELYFTNIVFVYWLAASVFFFWILFFVNKNNYRNHLLKIFTIGTFFYYLFFISFGFDTTDSGYQIARQYLQLNQGSTFVSFTSGTNIIGDLWLNISGGPFLLWARAGFVLVQLGISFFSYKILLLFFRPLRVFVVMIVLTVSMSFWQYYFTINYDNLPLMFFVMSSFYLLKSSENDNGAITKSDYILSGLFYFISVFCKITFISAIVPVLLIIYFSKVRKRNLSLFLTGLITGFLSVIFITLISGVFFDYMLLFPEIISTLTGSDQAAAGLLTRDHSLSALSEVYKRSLVSITDSYINISLTILLFSYFASRIKNNKMLKYTNLVAAVWFFYYMIFEPSASTGIVSLSFSLYVIWIICASVKELNKYKELAVISVTVFIASFIGSDLGISTALRAGSAPLLLSCSLLLSSESEIKARKINLSFKHLLPLIIVIFTAFYIQDDFRPYQDFKYSLLSESFRSPQLKGIKSNPARVAVVDSLLTYLNDIPDLKDKDIYFAKHSPMYYYLTGTKYRLDSPWDTLNRLEEIKSDFEKTPPEIIVLPKGSHRNFMWPNENKRWENEGGEIKAKPYYDFYDDFIEENDYIVTYENSFYTVYKLKCEDTVNESEQY